MTGSRPGGLRAIGGAGRAPSSTAVTPSGVGASAAILQGIWNTLIQLTARMDQMGVPVWPAPAPARVANVVVANVTSLL